MTPDRAASVLGTVLAEIGSAAVLLTGDEDALTRPVTEAAVWMKGDPLPDDPSILLICPGARSSSGVAELDSVLANPLPRMIVVTSTTPELRQELKSASGDHVVIDAGAGQNVAGIVLSVSRSTVTAQDAVWRRVTSIQRALSQALTDSTPVPALLTRLKQACNATAALIDRNGQAVHATGPVPLSLFFGEISKTPADSQVIDLDGWRGIAARIEDPVSPDDHFGWLLVTARRPDFPDPYATSAVHVAATLIEASQRMAVVSREQERAVRSAVLERALAFKEQRHDAELAGSIAGLGMSFDEELRTIVIRPVRSPRPDASRDALEDLSDRLGQKLRTAGVRYLMTTRDKTVTLLAQCSAQTAGRLFVTGEKGKNPAVYVGVGRPITVIGDIVDSYNDAQLAVRTLQQQSKEPRVLAYEDFNLSHRLFADVGLTKMERWAHNFLSPLEGRDALIEGIHEYFENGQNINMAADALSIHHNSLRYRLAKVETLLDLDLKDPSAVSSVFLALTAMGLSRQAAPKPLKTAQGPRALPDVEASGSATEFIQPPKQRLGVVFGPER